jgi:predicted CoA-binding protein
MHDQRRSEEGTIRRMLEETRTIAVVGASIKPVRPSHFVSLYMQAQGYRMLPVNPGYAGRTLFGETVRPDLASLEETPDMVVIFRRSAFAGAVADQACAIGARFVWMQMGIRDDAAAARAEARGCTVVMDRCLKVEHARLGIGRR